LKLNESLKEVLLATENELQKWNYTFNNIAKKRALSQFYTPPELSINMADELFRNITSIKPLLDPTCGDGNLLAASYYYLVSVYKVKKRSPEQDA
jgi:type I restriction-modification system DNA methylase subunit